MKSVQVTCSRCNAPMTLEKHGSYSDVSCPYCGNKSTLLIESDRVKIARTRENTERFSLRLRYREHLDFLTEARARRRIQLVIICVFSLITLILIGIFLTRSGGGWAY